MPSHLRKPELLEILPNGGPTQARDEDCDRIDEIMIVTSNCQVNTSITESDERWARLRGDKLSCRCIATVELSSDKVKPLDDSRNDVAPFDHRTYAYVSTRKALRNGANDVISNHLYDRPYVLFGQRVLVHERVHSRVNIRRRRGCQRA